MAFTFNHLLITNSTIACGDDFISIGDHTSHIQIRNIHCGPGHGISIGSLGRSGNFVQVEKIHVSNATFNGTTNGARIKTWQVGKGYVRGVMFEKRTLNNVKNPIIIDQNYCDVRSACKEQKSGVRISHVVYREVVGTSATKIAINLNCSKSVPCSGISMESIELRSTAIAKSQNIIDTTQVTADCRNAFGLQVDVVPAC